MESGDLGRKELQKGGEVVDWQMSAVGAAEDEGERRKRRVRNVRREMGFEETMVYVCFLGLGLSFMYSLFIGIKFAFPT